MVRRSAPASRRWVAKECRKVWQPTVFWMPAFRAVVRQIVNMPFVVIADPFPALYLLGNRQACGFIQRQYSRKVSSNFGLSGTSRSYVPEKVMCSGAGQSLRRQSPGSDCPAHNYLPLNEAMSLSAGRKPSVPIIVRHLPHGNLM
jgi:hypothetical protein